MEVFKLAAAGALFVGATLLMSGCASSTIDAQEVSAATVIDVRTPEEFAQGHLDGAVNIDVQSSSFTEQVEDLDRDDSYMVYCRSGNRSQVATRQLLDMGFTSVTDLGGLQQASGSTGLEVVR